MKLTKIQKSALTRALDARLGFVHAQITQFEAYIPTKYTVRMLRFYRTERTALYQIAEGLIN
jgi:hypothetical protein